jgi:5-methylcytosine-specific restriction endonuclease McrA
MDDETYKQTLDEINKIDNKTKAVDTYWRLQNINGESILPSTAVFWLFFWADTKGKDIGKKVFQNIFNISYENFYNALNAIKPGFKTDGGKNNRDRSSLISSKRISEKTLILITEILFKRKIPEQKISENDRMELEEQDVIASHLSGLSEEELNKEIDKMQNRERKTRSSSYSKKQRNQYLMELYKKKRGYKCQFCGKQILRANGNYYVEACHIIPVEDGGTDNENNIVILCPNCHKEFDYGSREEIKLNKNEYSVIVNGNKYEIKF